VDAKKVRPNLVDIARHAGVSPATVSRVMNNTAPVREIVRERVLSSISELGYEPTPIRPTTRAIENAFAILIPDILNPFFAEIIRGIQDEANIVGYSPILFDSAEDPEREKQFLRTLINQPMHGMILCGSRLAPEELATIVNHNDTPIVTVNRNIRHHQVACLRTDLEGGAARATRHLLALNHTRIAFLTGPFKSEPSLARRRGVEKAMAEAGLVLHPEWCPASFPNVDGGFQAMSALLAMPPANRPTAVIAYNDVMALGVLHAIRIHGLRVPEDISVIGVDDIAMAAHANPPLTTISQPKYRLGRTAMQTLYRMLQGHLPLEESFTLIESPLIVRESTAPAPIYNGDNS
jgi:DNA-binding LacI/PurR family transcriptional regulator